jgi:hypothetical protein
MKRTVTFALVMLIGSYGVAQAEDAPNDRNSNVEKNTKTEDATNDFLGLKWGAGVGVIGGFGGSRAVEKASIVNGVVRVEEEGEMRPQLFLEMHAFLGGPKVKGWRDGTSMDMDKPPKMGFGPFIALQSGDKEAIDSLAVGIMWGFRQDPQKSASLNIGFGLSFDPSVQVLGGGLKDGDRTTETEIRFKKESQVGWALMASFTF